MFSSFGKIQNILTSIARSPLVRLYLGNSFWVTFARCAWILQAVTIGIYVTRVLGPHRLGQFNYSLSMIGLLCIFNMMQCRDVLIRRLIRVPGFHNWFLGTNFVFRVCLFLLSAIPFFIFYGTATTDAEIKTMLLILLGHQMIIIFTENMDICFTATSRNRLEAYSQIASCLVYSGLRLWAAAVNMDVCFYAWIEVICAAVRLIFLLIFYRTIGYCIYNWRFDRRIFKKIIVCALPFFLASLTSTFYSRTDIVMLQALKGASDVGYYSLSARFTENITLLLSLLVTVFTPVVFLGAQESEELFRKQLHRLYSLVFWTATATALSTFIFCGIGVRLLYGAAYAPTAGLLRVFIFSILHCALSLVLNLWAVKTNRLLLSGLFNISGLLFNIPLNYILIRKFGASGAAWATLISAPLGTALVLSTFSSGRRELLFMIKSVFTRPSFKFSR